MTHLIPPRRMLPRWRPSTETMAATLMQPAVRRNLPIPRNNRKKGQSGGQDPAVPTTDAGWEHALDVELAQWQKNPDVGTAADMLSFAMYPEAREKLKEVAEYLAKQPSVAHSKALLELVGLVRDGAHITDIVAPLPPNAAVHALRHRLRMYPENPIALVDLALAHASLGNAKAAHRALLNAWTLAPTNRHTLTALARFLVHADEADSAQRFLERSPRTPTDPWLMSAVIAVGQITGRTPRVVRHARALVAGRSFSPAHMSELAGSLATLDLENGNRKEARKLFDTAIVAPTENVLAQLHWAHQSLNKPFEMQPAWAQAPLAFELRALQSFATCDTNVAVKWALRWQEDEPFSSRPVILATYLLSILGCYDDAIILCRAGLVTNPGDETLEQNLIYALILSGNYAEASTRLFKMARRSPSPMAMANVGCLLLAEGNPEGRRYYDKAIETFKDNGLHERAALAQGFFADALRRAGQDDWKSQLELAIKSDRAVQSPAFAMLRAELQNREMVGDERFQPQDRIGKRVPHWDWDKETNVVTLRRSRIL